MLLGDVGDTHIHKQHDAGHKYERPSKCVNVYRCTCPTLQHDSKIKSVK